MRTTLLALIGLAGLAAPAPAAAEDFTGFYAGVNAGYGFETGGRDGRGFVPGAPGDAPGSAADTGLPPSARDASRALQSRNRASPGSALPR
ncbi:hypothetical protein ASG63_15890 [Methylobacterium sp. Leaf94]|uniref:hypothetical protein n=1 Tax=unclassified Methylobacterium TaxID=2615210 RepID=UPI0006F6BD80|nr:MULTISPECIES: hypothetical protein [unclassified Methylobacterium]KQO67435.1 hypothetical protein ASF18_12415 [Methylobacterium sp. Leaf89]KQU31972.1 hypothetical protein ASG63_15890 [Methylobacterium sp. Leaf94]